MKIRRMQVRESEIKKEIEATQTPQEVWYNSSYPFDCLAAVGKTSHVNYKVWIMFQPTWLKMKKKNKEIRLTTRDQLQLDGWVKISNL